MTVDDNAVGYGRPPKHTRFKKGVSGNPKGRRPRTRNTSTLLKEELEKFIIVKDGSGERRITKRQALITSLVNDAITGKNQARQLLLGILEINNPPEPFVPNDDDTELIEKFLEQSRQKVDGDEPNTEG